jgi:transposase-like protein
MILTEYNQETPVEEKPVEKQKERRERTTYSVSFKKLVVTDLLENRLTAREIAKKYNVLQNSLTLWKRVYAKKLKNDLSKKRIDFLAQEENSIIAEIKKEYEKKIDLKNKELESLYSEIGKLTVKVKFLEGK